MSVADNFYYEWLVNLKMVLCLIFPANLTV